MKQVRADLMTEGRNDMASRVMSYRSGYSAQVDHIRFNIERAHSKHHQDRRTIEQKMFKGELLGIVATTALELGIDIGSLDAVITVGFPYTLSGLVSAGAHILSQMLICKGRGNKLVELVEETRTRWRF